MTNVNELMGLMIQFMNDTPLMSIVTVLLVGFTAIALFKALIGRG